MRGVIIGKCFLCGHLISEDEWDCAFDDGDFFVLAHAQCLNAIPQYIEAQKARIAFLEKIMMLKQAMEGGQP